MSNIKQNLFFAFVYNALGLPIAAGLAYPFFGLLLNPMIFIEPFCLAGEPVFDGVADIAVKRPGGAVEQARGPAEKQAAMSVQRPPSSGSRRNSLK